VLIFVVAVLAGYFIALSLQSLNILMAARGIMDYLWNGQTDVNKWGIGQIGAPFAWAPVLVDFCYDIFGLTRSWLRRSTGQGPAVEDPATTEVQEVRECHGLMDREPQPASS